MNAQIIDLPFAQVAQPLAVGELIGRYRIEAVIGEGGMGVVLMARHLDLDMKVAIKVIRSELVRDERIVERMMNEARSVASLRSDHVVRVFDVARLPNGTPYMVLELVEGPDLDRVLEASGPMAVDDAIAYVLDVCLGLSDAHSRGIIHRDIKPENLLVESLTDGTSRVKISDFGIAKQSMTRREMSKTQESGSVGSPWYMAPEQMVNAPDVDARADVWSVGVVLYELLTGTMPFPGDTPGEVCARVMSMPPISIDEVRPGLPSGVKAVLDRCLEKARGMRYPDVAELARDLAVLSPAGAAKARSVALRLGAEDVTFGRTLTNIPAVRVVNPLPEVPRLRLAAEDENVVVALHEVPGVRRLWPRVLAATALVAMIALAAIPVTRTRIIELARAGVAEVSANVRTQPPVTNIRAVAPEIRLPIAAIELTPQVTQTTLTSSAPPVIIGPAVEVPPPVAPRFRERAPRTSVTYVSPPVVHETPAPAAPADDYVPTPSEPAAAPPAEIIPTAQDPSDSAR